MYALTDWLVQTALRAALLLSALFAVWPLLPASRPALRRRVLLLASGALLIIPFVPGGWSGLRIVYPPAAVFPSGPDKSASAGGAWPSGTLTIPQLLLLSAAWVWPGGSLLVLLRLATSWLALRRILLTAVPCHCRPQGCPPGVRVLQSAAVTGPCVAGALHPVLLLPEKARFWSAAEWAMVAAHESQHLRQQDPRLAWLPRLALACYWWLPPVWWLQRSFQVECEVLCDRAVVSGRDAASTREYAGFLLALQHALPAPASPALTTAMAMKSTLGRRLERLLSPAAGLSAEAILRPGHRILLAAAPGLLAGAAIIAGSLSTAPPRDPSLLTDSPGAGKEETGTQGTSTLSGHPAAARPGPAAEAALRLSAGAFPADD